MYLQTEARTSTVQLEEEVPEPVTTRVLQTHTASFTSTSTSARTRWFEVPALFFSLSSVLVEDAGRTPGGAEALPTRDNEQVGDARSRTPAFLKF